MGIFKNMYDGRSFSSERDYEELKRMLSEAMSRGHVERVPVPNSFHFWGGEWYRDKDSGEVYCLKAPDVTEKLGGYWGSIGSIPSDNFAKDKEREPRPNGNVRLPPLIRIVFLKHEVVYGRETDDLIRAIAQLCSQRELEEWWEREIRSEHGQLILIKARARLAELVRRAKEGGWEMHR